MIKETVSDTTPAYLRISDVLRRRILSGELRPGDRLPSPDELAATHRIGRSTVREALRLLEAENLVVTARGVTGGTFVNRPDPTEVARTFTNGLFLLSISDAVGLDQLLEARRLLEVPAAGMAADLVSADPSLVEPLTATIPDGPVTERFAANRDFHTALLRTTGNPVLATMTMPLFEVLGTRYRRDPGDASWERVDEEHRAIHAAVAAGDAPEARRLMDGHLDGLHDVYRRGRP